MGSMRYEVKEVALNAHRVVEELAAHRARYLGTCGCTWIAVYGCKVQRINLNVCYKILALPRPIDLHAGSAVRQSWYAIASHTCT